jgi:hypothetical protein
MKRKRMIRLADLQLIDDAAQHVAAAKRLLRIAGSVRAAEYVARAEKSIQGALRHAHGMLSRDQQVLPNQIQKGRKQ